MASSSARRSLLSAALFVALGLGGCANLSGYGWSGYPAGYTGAYYYGPFGPDEYGPVGIAAGGFGRFPEHHDSHHDDRADFHHEDHHDLHHAGFDHSEGGFEHAHHPEAHSETAHGGSGHEFGHRDGHEGAHIPSGGG